MPATELCDFCRDLVFWKAIENPNPEPERVRPLRDIHTSVACPFCNAVGAIVAPENTITDTDVQCVYELLKFQDGFIHFTTTIRDLTQADAGLDTTVVFRNRTSEEYMAIKQPYWMVAYAEDGKPEAWERFHNRADWKPLITMDIDTRFDSVVEWLDTCVKQKEGDHTNCFGNRMPGYPSRLLDIEGYETNGHIRLIDSEDLPEPRPEYTTLSHCWGRSDGPRPLRTTTENLKAHKTSILFHSLPKTFRDAINITHRIGKSLLWIDSLAIVQDDMEEWEHEAAQMAGIYANSFLTIAATQSTNCEGGCGLEPWTSDVTEATARAPDGPFLCLGAESCVQPHTQYQLKLKRTNPYLKYEPIPKPLHTRGWVLQELLLSPRVVHMAHRHMLWQCREHFDEEDASACFSDQVRLWHESNNPSFVWNRFRIHYDASWWYIVEKYTGMDFTHVSDKLPAMAGMVQYHGIKRQDTSLVGLWKKSLPMDLAWHCRTPKARRFPGLPTWSWLSSQGEVCGPPNLLPRNPMASYDDTSRVEWRGQAYVSKLQSAILVVRTKVFHAILDNATPIGEAVEEKFRKTFLTPFLDGRHAILDEVAAPQIYLPYFSDITMADQTSDGVAITYMLLYTNADSRKRESVIFLALRAALDDSSAYVRIGWGNAVLGAAGDKFQPSDWPSPGLVEHVLKDWTDATVKLL